MSNTEKTIVQQHAKNFATLKQAFANGDAALVECKVKATGEIVAAICAVESDGNEMFMTPFALMMNGNPFELLLPPDPGDPNGFVGDES